MVSPTTHRIRSLYRHPYYGKCLVNAMVKSVLKSTIPGENVPTLRITTREQLVNYITAMLDAFSHHEDRQVYALLRYVAGSTKLRAPTENASRRVSERANTVSHVLKYIRYDSRNIRRIVDVGCDDGSIVHAIGERFGLSPQNIIGVDLHAEPPPAPITYVRAVEGQPYAIEDNSVDLVTMFVTLHHVKSRAHIESVKKMLRRGGLLIIREHDCSDDSYLHDYLDVIHGLSEIVSRGVDYDEFHADYYADFLSHGDIANLLGMRQVFYSTYQVGNNPQRLYHAAYIKG